MAVACLTITPGTHDVCLTNRRASGRYTVDSHDEHLQTVDYLARTGRPAVVIAASGMAAGGRVVNYLKRMLGDDRECRCGEFCVTRQNMRKLMLAHPDTFPPPVHGGSTLIWHLDDVLDWLSARGRYPVAQTTLETARLSRQLNLARERRHLKPEVVKTLDAYLA